MINFAENRGNGKDRSGTGTTLSQTIAYSSGVPGNPAYGGASYTSPPSGCGGLCLYPGYNEYGEASIDATTGRGRVEASVGFSSGTGGLASAEAGFTLTDTLDVDLSQPLLLTLDLSYSELAIRLGVGADRYAGAGGEYSLRLFALDEGIPELEMSILFDSFAYEGGPSHGYVMTVFYDGIEQFREQDSTNPLPFAFHLAAAYPSFPPIGNTRMGLELSLRANAGCLSIGTPGCAARISSPNSSYLSLTGAYSSQNGYAYLGPEPSAGVPEPQTGVMVAAALLAWALRRRA